jgi:hypothetical protein
MVVLRSRFIKYSFLVFQKWVEQLGCEEFEIHQNFEPKDSQLLRLIKGRKEVIGNKIHNGVSSNGRTTVSGTVN